MTWASCGFDARWATKSSKTNDRGEQKFVTGHCWKGLGKCVTGHYWEGIGKVRDRTLLGRDWEST